MQGLSTRKAQHFEDCRSFGLRQQYRRKIFDAAALEWLAEHARQVFAKMDCRLLASEGEADHLHILLEYPPKLSVSVLVNAFKGTSSRMLGRNRPDIACRYRDGALWSPAYFAASAGDAALAIIKQYVEQQRRARCLLALKGEVSGALKIW